MGEWAYETAAQSDWAAAPAPAPDTIGERIRGLRLAAGISGADLGRQLGVSSASVSLWESGKVQVRRKHLDLIATIFDVSLQYLLAGDRNDKADLNDEVRLLIHCYRQMDEDSKRAVLLLARRLRLHATEGG